MKTGLILEGGGMRGIFTAGVLDFFLEKDLEFSECLAVSAGACHACSFLAKQKGRAYAVGTDYLDNRRYCSLYSLLTTGELFGSKLLYHEIPEKLYPIDNEAFKKSKIVFLFYIAGYGAAGNKGGGDACIYVRAETVI